MLKGWSRKGTSLCYLKRYEEAKIAFEEGLKIEPDNQQLKEGLAEAESNLTGWFLPSFNLSNNLNSCLLSVRLLQYCMKRYILAKNSISGYFCSV
jgi:tetratricopeptide (TPR) repeat protein